MIALRVRKSGPLAGRVRLPSDLQIGQEALLWAALADGPSHLIGLSPREDHRLLIAALRALGVPIAEVEGGVRVAGVGLAGLRMPAGALDAGDSPSTLELISALLAGQRFGTRVEARGRALQHPLGTLLEPLRARGAQIAGAARADGELGAPVSVAPLLANETLAPVEIEIPMGDAATKRGLLISGLYARGVTAISEGILSRDHSERALMALGLSVETSGPLTLLDTTDGAAFAGFTWSVPGDFGLASFLIAAASAAPGSDVLLEGVSVNRSRSAFLDALRHAGAGVAVLPKGDAAGNEPLGDVRVRAATLRGVRIMGELSLRMLDEVPALAALAPACRGRITLRDAHALRARGGDPLRGCAQILRAFGAECTDYDDGFDLDPGTEWRGVEVPAATAPELKLLALVLGLAAAGETRIEAAGELDALYPGFVDALISLGADVAREGQA
jgi:3-phosphoshikimate 1-carboxyvinyltransferase